MATAISESIKEPFPAQARKNLSAVCLRSAHHADCLRAIMLIIIEITNQHKEIVIVRTASVCTSGYRPGTTGMVTLRLNRCYFVAGILEVRLI